MGNMPRIQDNHASLKIFAVVKKVQHVSDATGIN